MEKPVSMGYSSPQIRRQLSDLKNRDIRDQAILSLRQQVQQMELSSVPRFLQHVSESSCEGSPKRYAVSLFGECAKKHGPLIIRDMPKLIGHILRELARESSTTPFYDTCADVILDIVRYCGKEPRQAEEVMDSIVQKMAPALVERCETLATGSAVCLEALVSCEKWKMASESTQREVWCYTTQAVKDPLRTVSHLQLGIALARTNCTLLKENARFLLQAGLEVVAGASQWQRRLFAVKLVREIFIRCDESTFQAEVQNTEAALIACESEPMERVQMEMANLWTMLSALKDKWEPNVFAENGPSNVDKRNSKVGSFTPAVKSAFQRSCWGVGGKPGTDTPGYEDNLILRSDAGELVELESGHPEKDRFGKFLTRPSSQRKLFYEGTPTSKLTGAGYILPTNSSLARSRGPFDSSTSKGTLKTRSPTKLARTESDTSVASRNSAKKNEASSSLSCESKESPCTDVLYGMAEEMGDDGKQLGTRQESSSNSNGVEQTLATRRSASRAESDGSNRIQGVDDDVEGQVLASVLLSEPGMFAEFSSPSIDSRETAGLPSSNKGGQWEREGGHEEDMDVFGEILPMETQVSIGSMMNDKTEMVNSMGHEYSSKVEARSSSSKDKTQLPKAVRPTVESGKQYVNSTIRVGAPSLDSSHGSLSGCTSTTSSSAGKLGGMRLVRPLEKATGPSTSRSLRVTEEDMLIGLDPRQLLISLQSSSSALNQKESQQTASTASTVRAEETSISGLKPVNERLSRERSFDSSVATSKEDWSSCHDVDNNSLVRPETEDGCESNLVVHCRMPGMKSSNDDEKIGDRLENVLGLDNANPAEISREDDELSAVDLVEDDQAEERRESAIDVKNINGKHNVTVTGSTQCFSENIQFPEKDRQQQGLRKRDKIMHSDLKNAMTDMAEQFEVEDDEDMDSRVSTFAETASLHMHQNCTGRPIPQTVLRWIFELLKRLLEVALQGCVAIVIGFHILLLITAICKLSEIGLKLPPT